MINPVPENAAPHGSRMELPPREAGDQELRVGESSICPSVLTVALMRWASGRSEWGWDEAGKVRPFWI